ncbi:MAG TPA: glycosyltransferase family 39 protein [Anaerolineae bacterium]|nr:glycosyltransferase family 39 protein [Anaerolineae bacterium]
MTQRHSSDLDRLPNDGGIEAGLSRSWEAVLLLLIILLAAALRFYRITEIPPGLHFDEGFKAVTARALLEGAPPQLFFERDMGEEPIAMYLVAAALALVGQEPWVVRLPSAIVGTLTVPLAWWLGRELFRLAQQGKRLQRQFVGLGAALVLAILYWHLSFSRIGMEPILVPFFATLAFAALARGLNLGSHRMRAYFFYALAGLALGGSLYTYKAGYLVPVLAALFVGYAAIVERGFLRQHGRGLLLMALVALLAALPIVVYFATHPANFLQRPLSVTLVGGSGPSEGTLAGPWQDLAGNLPRVLGMFFLRGDANPRSNLPGRPALNPFLAVLFLVGLGRSLVGFRRPALALPPIWLGVMILPTLLTEHAPHFGRAIGATPALALLCALGCWFLVFGTRDWPLLRSAGIVPTSVIAIVLAAGLAFSGVSTAQAYFQRWGQSPDLFYAYDKGLVQIAEYMNSLPPDEDVYLTPTPDDHYTLQFLSQRPFSSFDGRSGLLLPPPGRAATVIVLSREDEATLPTLQGARPDGRVTQIWTDDANHPYAMAYHLPAVDHAAIPQPDFPVEALLDSSVRLLGYSVDSLQLRSGDTIHLTLHWQALAPLDKDYTVFTHLLGEQNPVTNGPLWAGHDGQPNGGHYPTTAWQPGQVIIDVHPLAIPAGTPPGEYQLEAGLYLLETMTRLPAFDAAGNHLASDAIVLGTIAIGD